VSVNVSGEFLSTIKITDTPLKLLTLSSSSPSSVV
jgi:hypothetical protein